MLCFRCLEEKEKSRTGKILWPWIPWLGKQLTFRVSNDDGRPIFSEGRLCLEEGCSTSREAYSDVLTLTNSEGHTVEITMIHSCGYVPFQSAPSAAAPFSEGGGTSSGGGPTPPVAPDVEHEDVPAPPSAEQPAETSEPPPPEVPPPPAPHPETSEWRLRREACSRKHRMTHLPFNKYCPVCNAGKTRKEKGRAKSLEERE